MVTKPEDHFQDPQGHLRAMASYITEAWSQGGKSELRYSKVRPQADSFLKAAADNAARWRGDVSDIMPAPTWFSCCHWQQILDGGNAYRPKEGKWHPNRTQSILWRTLGCKVFLCWAWEDVLNVTLISTGWDNTSWSGRELSWGWAPYGSLGLCLLFIFNTHTQIIIQKNTLLKQKILPFLRQPVIRPSPQDNIDQLRHHRGSCMLDTATWLLWKGA